MLIGGGRGRRAGIARRAGGLSNVYCFTGGAQFRSEIRPWAALSGQGCAIGLLTAIVLRGIRVELGARSDRFDVSSNDRF